MAELFSTGAGGFLGRRLAGMLPSAEHRRAVCLVRRELPELRREGIELVVGDLLDPASFAPHLAPQMTVIHLAAVTGKARRADYWRANVEATRKLLDACRQRGVRRLIFVSSIAAGFRRQEYYHYGQSKKAAEELVRASGLDTLIVRPTMIFGPGAPVLEGLAKLASLPVVPVFGDGKVRVQPIDVEDLARCLLRLAGEGVFGGRLLELGGPEAVTIEELLARIHRRKTGRSPKIVHLPLRGWLPVLAGLEKFLLGVLPLTAGQLASFRNDGTAEPNELWLEARGGMKTLEEMLESGLGEDEALARECRLWCRYLAGVAPTDYLTARYLECHRRSEHFRAAPDAVDRMLLGLARTGRLGARLADSYATFFRPASLLRRKLVLLLALMECAPPTCVLLDRPTARTAAGALARIGFEAVISLLALAVSLPVIGPLHLAARRRRSAP
jgi:nucleoside-diphosphate-sugar epimerase